VKRSILLILTLSVCAPLFGAGLDPKLDRAVRAAIPVCAEVKIEYAELPMKLPERFVGSVVTMESSQSACQGQLVAVLSPTGGFYLGNPWPLADEQGATVEEKLKNFTWRNLQENVTVSIDRTRTDDGLFPTTLSQTTENGKMPLHGAIDAQGKVFFFGNFRRLAGDVRAERAKTFEPFFAQLPAKGANRAAVTIVEFSDFQCPSCKRSSGYADKVLAKHGDKVRYIRFDLPLGGHPWAFPAALAGRAIHRQKPDLFWDYKKQVYENQENLNAFMFWDWARAWAEDHDLDMAKYDADLQSADIKAEILNGAGTAFSNDVRATPTFMINGAMVDTGDEGKGLVEYVDKMVAK
jgi:hypothetical protein